MKITIPALDARKSAALAVTLVTVGFWLVILTYPKFYLFNPFETRIVVFRIEQIFSTLGWILFAFMPMLFAWVPEVNGKSTRILYLVSSSLWPLAVLVIQTTLAVQGGGFYSYIGRNPIFALNDILAPILLIVLANTLFPALKAKRKKISKR